MEIQNKENNKFTKIERIYKDLKVFKQSYELGLKIHKICLGFPDFEKFAISNQLRKSAMSIPVNIAEGMSRQQSPSDVVRFIKMAIGSCDETIVWLNYSNDLGYIDQDKFDSLVNEYEQVGKMLTGLIKHWLLKV